MKVWLFIVRWFIRPFLTALKEGLGEWEWKKGLTVDAALMEQLQKMSRERVEILLKDKLADDVAVMQAALERLAAQVKIANEGVNSLRADNAALIVALSKTNKRLLILEKTLKAQKEVELLPRAREIETPVIDFGGKS
jgi:hypothetical protein